ncbi:MAG: hypothetical protein EZS28_031586, partial [Streblomastix strix]
VMHTGVQNVFRDSPEDNCTSASAPLSLPRLNNCPFEESTPTFENANLRTNYPEADIPRARNKHKNTFVFDYEGPKSTVTSLAYCLDDKAIVCGTEKGELFLFLMIPLVKVPFHVDWHSKYEGSPLTCIIPCPQYDSAIALGYANGAVRIISVYVEGQSTNSIPKAKLVTDLGSNAHNASVQDIDWLPRSINELCTVGYDGRICFIDIAIQKVIRSIRIKSRGLKTPLVKRSSTNKLSQDIGISNTQIFERLTSITFNPDATCIAIGTERGDVVLLRIKQREDCIPKQTSKSQIPSSTSSGQVINIKQSQYDASRDKQKVKEDQKEQEQEKDKKLGVREEEDEDEESIREDQELFGDFPGNDEQVSSLSIGQWKRFIRFNTQKIIQAIEKEASNTRFNSIVHDGKQDTWLRQEVAALHRENSALVGQVGEMRAELEQMKHANGVW